MLGEGKYVGVLTTDVHWLVRSWDAWLVEATGLPESSVLGRSLFELFPEIEQRGLRGRLERAATEGTVEILAPAFHHYLIRCAAPGAQPHFDAMQQHVTVSPLRDGATIRGLAFTIEDVTARCVRERELAAQLKSRDEAIRVRAARLLSSDPLDPRPLLTVMNDVSWQVRQAAVRGVADNGDEDVIRRLIDAIRNHHGDISLLNSALSALEQSRTDAVPHLLSLTGDADPEVRMYTALALGNLKDRRAVPALIDLLEDPDVNVRYHAIEALGRVRARESAPALLPFLENRDSYLAFAALDAIAAIGERSVTPVVRNLLDDELLGSGAVEALAVIGDEQSAAALAHALDRRDLSAVAVCRALSAIYRRLEDEYGEGQLVGDVVQAELSASAVLRILDCIATTNDDDLVAVARVLGWLRYDGVEQALARLLTHPRARKIASQALVQRGPAATEALARELDIGDTGARKAAVQALGRIGDTAAVPALVEVLRDDVPDVLIAAAGALGAIGDNAAFEPLLVLLSHDDAAVRSAAVSAINSIGHPDMAQRMPALLASADDRVRESALRIAGYFGFSESFEAVLSLLSDPVENVRRAAVEHLGFFDDPRVLPALAAALKGTSPVVRAVAARALAHVTEPAVEPHLRQAIADPDPRVRYQAVQAIAAQRLPEFAPVLRKLAREETAVPVRIAAARALGEMRDAAAAPLLAELSQHPETDIAVVAIAALALLPGANVTATLGKALSSDEPRRQRAALATISERQLPELVPALERLANTATDAEIATSAIALLARSDGEEAIDLLLRMSSNPQRRAEVIAALSQVEEKQIGRIARGLRHPDAGVRSATVEALARMKRAAASRALGAALDDQDPAVRFATQQALGRLDLLTSNARPR